MKSRERFVVVLACLIAVGCLLVACQAQQPTQPAAPAAAGAPAGGEELSGTIRVSGAWALYPMMVRWGEEFTKLHPKVRVDVSAGGAGKGAADALAGLVDLGMVSRAIKPEEISQGGAFVPVAKDAVFPTINAANPMLAKGLMEKGIKRETLVNAFIAGKAVTWGEVVGETGGPAIQAYTRSDSCGAAETWSVYLGGKAQEDLHGVAVYGDPGLAEAVRRDVAGLGFNNLNFVFDAKTGAPMEGLIPVPIDVNENGVVDETEKLPNKAAAIAAVANGNYPSPPARDLNLLTKQAFTDLTKIFVHWILTDGQKYLDEVGYIPVAEAELKAAVEKVSN